MCSSDLSHLYRLNHPLAEALLSRAKSRELPPAEIEFNYADHEGKVSILEPHIGASGWLTMAQFSVNALDQAEDHLLCAGVTDTGQTLDRETVCRLLTLPGQTGKTVFPLSDVSQELDREIQREQQTLQRIVAARNARFFEDEVVKLDGWAEDLKVGLERELRELDRQIKEARRAATLALTLEEKLTGQKQIKTLEATRNHKRRSLFDAQDQVDVQREELIALVEGKLSQQSELTSLFTLRWSLT